MSSFFSAATGRRRLLAALFLASLSVLGGCHTRARKKPVTAQSLYVTAHKALVNNDYEYSIKQYEALTSRFPFSSEARQARLDLIYVYYRKGDKESAVDASDQFLRENPTHPRVDYAQYMKGMMYFERQPYSIERWFGTDMAKHPPSDALKAIAAFNVVVTQYPNSEYAHDALRRMTYLRNRLAEYEVWVARWYVRRGAYIAAARRAEGVVEQYDGAPAEQDAMLIMHDCYVKLGFTQLADNVQQVYQANYANRPRVATRAYHWYTFWR